MREREIYDRRGLRGEEGDRVGYDATKEGHPSASGTLS
jgi:hypothetical protein